MASTDRPMRTQSVNHRTVSTSSTPHRTQSHQQSRGRANSSSYQGNLNNVARKDHEQVNLARSQSSNRNSSREQNIALSNSARAESTRSSNRSHPKSGAYGRYAEVTPTKAAGDATGRVPPGSSGSARRRTTIGATSGQWALGKTIGAGSMGKVKIAKNLDNGEQVAVKIVPRQSTDEHRSLADRERADHSKEIRTAREAAIVTLVNHPYICGMKDVVRTNYHWYMLFEYVNGGQMLDYIISRGRLKEKPARKFARQIASALDYCHRNSIVHRDLKIENILISKTGDIKIIDFGLSNLFAPRNYLRTFCGSLYFAAPELLQAKQYTGPEVDIWSFGIVLYVLVCGKVPFDDQSMPQLHAKIKKGVVEYPPWLSSDCKNLISRMLVTDPKQRASLNDIMNHPWITKGFNAPPENYLPYREPLQLPLDPMVINKMTGFDFGSPEHITEQLTKILESDDYQQASRLAMKRSQVQTHDPDRKRGVFEFYKRRNSVSSRDTLTNPSNEVLQVGADPINAFNPLVSIYYLVREKQDRELAQRGLSSANMPVPSSDKSLKMPDLPMPEAAVLNNATYEMTGEKPTGGRSRPRARTQGEDEAKEGLQNLNLNVPGVSGSPVVQVSSSEQAAMKKENSAAGIFRRLSARRYKDVDRDKNAQGTNSPTFAPRPVELAANPRKSFSIRRAKDKEVMISGSGTEGDGRSRQSELLSPQSAFSETTRRLKGLGRSTSVNSADIRRRFSRRGASDSYAKEPPLTGGSDRSAPRAQVGDAASDDLQTNPQPRLFTSKVPSSSNYRESLHIQRARKHHSRVIGSSDNTSSHFPQKEETYAPTETATDSMKPVYLKGLFSVSTTSSKALPFIRADLIRVFNELGIEYREVKGGFSCRHAPSIDLDKARESGPTSTPQGSISTPIHKRRISFGGFIGNEKPREEVREQHRSPQTPRSTRQKQTAYEQSFTNSEDSYESMRRVVNRPRAAGETTTQIQNDMGQNMILKFEIFVVKVPLLSLHGIQFKKVDGGTWQYKNMAQKILNELRL